MAFNDVYSASERIVYIGEWDITLNADTGGWKWTKLTYKRNFDPQLGEGKRKVFDGLAYMGDKADRQENSLTLEQEYRGFGKDSIYYWENKSDILIKDIIEPEDTGLVIPAAEQAVFYTKVSFGWVKDGHSDNGENNISITANFDKRKKGIINPDSDLKPTNW